MADVNGHDDGGADADVDTDGEDAEERTPFLRGRRVEQKAHGNGAPRAMSIDPLAPSSVFDEALRDRLRADAERQRHTEEAIDEDDEREHEHEQEDPLDDEAPLPDRVLERNWTAPAGKRIAVPIRIEPKVYFAAERTFFVRARLYLVAAQLFG